MSFLGAMKRCGGEIDLSTWNLTDALSDVKLTVQTGHLQVSIDDLIIMGINQVLDQTFKEQGVYLHLGDPEENPEGDPLLVQVNIPLGPDDMHDLTYELSLFDLLRQEIENCELDADEAARLSDALRKLADEVDKAAMPK